MVCLFEAFEPVSYVLKRGENNEMIGQEGGSVLGFLSWGLKEMENRV